MTGSDPSETQESEQVVEGTAVKTPDQAGASGSEGAADEASGSTTSTAVKTPDQAGASGSESEGTPYKDEPEQEGYRSQDA